ncbi:hypothetical protein SteCoe_19108 [Stentor coeruleus]|uniref:RING-type domain-containing protein n=1 Tax=Stentor coeruleus TaxID=5963 RepID=A0A1R2BUW3_9CILI|nr:hypothetical protein SteCoe_19108 [Stentor coeruleus]
MDFECHICSNPYTSAYRIPKVIPCGHTFCSICLEDLQKRQNLICPQCQKSWDSSNPISTNHSLVKLIIEIELYCQNHNQGQLAVCINRATLVSLCEQCAQNIPEELKIQVQKAKSWLKKQISSFIPIVSAEVQEEIKDIEKKSNADKLEFLKKLKLLMDKIFCDNHRNKESTALDLTTGKTLCLECIPENQASIIDIGNRDFPSTLLKRLTKLRRLCKKVPVQGSLQKNIKELGELDKKELIAYYKKLLEEDLGDVVVFNKNYCGICDNNYSDDNEPLFLPCFGVHSICLDCTRGLDVISCPYGNLGCAKNCPIELTESIWDKNHPVPNCEACKQPYDLKLKLPKVLPCRYVICFQCLGEKRHYLRDTGKCKYCQEVHEKVHSLCNNEYFMSKVRKQSVYCSIHKHRLAVKLNLDSWMSMCEECRQGGEVALNLSSPGAVVFDTLNREFAEKFENPEFRSNCLSSTEPSQLALIYYSASQAQYTNRPLDQFRTLSLQAKIDTIRLGLNPEKKNHLRTSMPKGRILIEKTFNEDFAYVYRFYSVMPPEEFNYNFIPQTKPWIIYYERNQIEAVAFTCDKKIVLCGIGFGQALNKIPTLLEFIEIRIGKSLLAEPKMIQNKKQEFHYNGVIEDIMFEKPIEILPDMFYNIKAKIKGQLLFRGNPFDLKEAICGSDGTVFKFAEPENIGDYYINGQHHFNGPIIKLIYKEFK